MSQGSSDRNENSLQHSYDHDAKQCSNRERELRTTDAVKCSQFRQIDQIDCGRHKNGTKNSDWQIGEHISNIEYGSSQCGGSD